MLIITIFKIIGAADAAANLLWEFKIPPKKEDKLLKIHGDTRVDPYYWLNNRENPEVISYLEEENKYSQSVLKSTKKFQKELTTNLY